MKTDEAEIDDEIADEEYREIAALATKGAVEKLRDRLIDLSICPLAATLFVVAWASRKRCSAVVDAAKGLNQKIADLSRDREFTFRTLPNADPATARQRVDEIEQQLGELRTQQSQAHAAGVHLIGVERRFPRLFGLQPVGEGDKRHWPPVVDAAPPELFEELRRLNLPSNIRDPWKYFPPMPLPTRPRKVVPALAGN